MWEYAIPAVASAVGSWLGYEGQKETNEANSAQAARAMEFSGRQADKQMDFQRDMSNTSYQRATADMKAAGLNPMLAYSQGGASSPGGASGSGFQATMGNKAAAAVSSAQAALSSANMMAQNNLLEAQTSKTLAERALVEAQTGASTASAGNLTAQTDNIRQEMQSFTRRMEKLEYDTTSSLHESGIKHSESLMRNRTNTFQAQNEDILRRSMAAEAQSLIHKATLLGLDIPESLSQAAFWRSPAGRSKPFTDYGLESAGKVINSAGGILRNRRAAAGLGLKP